MGTATSHGAKAIGAIAALSPVDSATWVGFEASIGRGAHARRTTLLKVFSCCGVSKGTWYQ
eukprot:COSAG01_NODE_925_length_12707_cov_21.250297_8_plen_61_part_00